MEEEPPPEADESKEPEQTEVERRPQAARRTTQCAVHVAAIDTAAVRHIVPVTCLAQTVLGACSGELEN